MKTSDLLLLASLGCGAAAADLNVKAAYKLNTLVSSDQTLVKQLMDMPNCTESGNGANIRPGAVAAINMANAALHNTNQSLFN